VQAKVREGSPEEEVELRKKGFVKQVGFKPEVKERGSHGWAEWSIRRGEEVTGEIVGESELEELVPEW